MALLLMYVSKMLQLDRNPEEARDSRIETVSPVPPSDLLAHGPCGLAKPFAFLAKQVRPGWKLKSA